MLTGFLGSGKTTLLSRLVRSPRFADTAVVINEFGEIRFQASHAMSLFDLNCKYADVIPSREVQDYLRGLPAPADAARE
ncbi:hypothetical protein CTI14_46660 [Methylobacterium radiotolerans]|nr:hypothetical protein CTI14_46660 [Methylobacterium radiotolerans]